MLCTGTTYLYNGVYLHILCALPPGTVKSSEKFEVMEAHGANERQNRPVDQVGEAAYTNIKILYPIPVSAIQTDPNLQQNPGY